MDFTDDDTASGVVSVEPTFPDPSQATEEDVAEYYEHWIQANPRAAAESKSTGDDDPTVQLPYSKAVDENNTKYKSEFPWLYDPARGVRWDFDPIELRVLSQENAWVGMLVQTITKEIAETSWTITDADDAAETRKRINTDPERRDPVAKELPDVFAEEIHDLLMNPSPEHDWYDAVEMWMADLLEVGSMTAVKAFPTDAYDDDNNLIADAASLTPRALMPSAPEVWTKDYSTKSGILDGFWQFDNHSAPGQSAARTRGAGQPIQFDREEVIWSDMAPRTNRRYGMPPTLLVRDFLQSLDLAVTQEQQYLSRGSIPSGAWIFENLSQPETDQIKQELNENAKGKPHKSMLFGGEGGNVKFEPMSMNFKELEFTERMRWYARVVASAFQVPTAVVGIEPEKVNYNTFQGERENFESNTLGPYLQQLERIINKQIIQPHWGDEYRFEFVPGMSETTRKMISDRVGSEFDRNLTTRNEARRELGREPVDEIDDGFKDEVVEGGGGEEDIDQLFASEGDADFSDGGIAKQDIPDNAYSVDSPEECGGSTVQGPQGGLYCVPEGGDVSPDDVDAPDDESAAQIEEINEIMSDDMADWKKRDELADVVSENTPMNSARFDDFTPDQAANAAEAFVRLNATDQLDGLNGVASGLTQSTIDASGGSAAHAYDPTRKAIELSDEYLTPEQGQEWFEDNHLAGDSVNHMVAHEVGHHQHWEAHRNDEIDMGEIRDKEMTPQEINMVETELSTYAAASPQEFVAEAYAVKAGGGELSGPLQDMYEEFGGVEPV